MFNHVDAFMTLMIAAPAQGIKELPLTSTSAMPAMEAS